MASGGPWRRVLMAGGDVRFGQPEWRVESGG